MIINLWRLLNNNNVLNEIQSVIKHIVVDEYQDNNYALSQIIRRMCNDQSSNIIRKKRAISPVSGKLFKKHQVSLESFTKVASTRLDTKTWPKLVPIMFVSIIFRYMYSNFAAIIIIVYIFHNKQVLSE